MDFSEGVERAKRIEKNALEHIRYRGTVAVDGGLDLYPEEVQVLGMQDLLNRYARLQKVIKASQLQIFETMPKAAPQAAPAMPAAKAAPPVPSIEFEEVETKVRALTTHAVEELEKERAPSPPAPEELQFERTEHVPPSPVEEKKAEIPPPLVMPPSLPETSSRFEEIQQKYEEKWGGKIDESTVKKTMLDLTKELFREKSVHRREEIKTEITALKNMLQGKGKSRAKTSTPLAAPMFSTLESAHTREVADMKDALAAFYNQQTDAAKNKFYQKLAGLGEGEQAARKQLYETLVFELTALDERLPDEIKEKALSVARKHREEMEKMQASVKDKKTLQMLNARGTDLEARYENEFRLLRESISKNIETMIERIGHEIFQEETTTESKEKARSTIFEINETDAGTLLFYLHSKDPELYKRYERKHLSKPEALLLAKILLAQEKGLSDDVIRKFFGAADTLLPVQGGPKRRGEK